MNKNIQLRDLGNKDYKETWDYQETLFKEIVDVKLEKRNNPQLVTPNFFLFVEHPHVYTLGKSGDISNLLLSEKQLAAKGATVLELVFIALIEAATLLITVPDKLLAIRYWIWKTFLPIFTSI